MIYSMRSMLWECGDLSPLWIECIILHIFRKTKAAIDRRTPKAHFVRARVCPGFFS
jgi:hypothetical protein